MSLGLKKRYLMSLVQSGGVSPRLPSAYQEVEYIESSGTQYIKTGVSEFQKLKTETDFAFTSWDNSNEFAMGGIYSYQSYTKSCRMEIVEIYKPRDNYFGFGADGGFFNSTIVVDTSKHKVIIDNVSGYINCDNNQVATFSTTTTSPNGSTNDIYLFAFHSFDDRGNNSVIAKCSMKIYSCKIWKSGILERDFVPCYRKSDNEIGLYDLVNDEFYTNQGSGTFTCGVPIIYDSRYQQVEYIESSGSGDIGDQYIDTGYTANKNTSVIYKFAYSQITTYGRHILSGPKYFFPLLRSLSNKNLFASVEGAGNVQVSFSYSLNQAYEFEAFITANTIKIDGVSKGTITMSSASTDTGVLYLFGRNDSGSPSAKAKGKLYYCKIYESGTKVREFIPVYRIADNEIGLLDIVNDVFYTNQGSGVFTMGSAI